MKSIANSYRLSKEFSFQPSSAYDFSSTDMLALIIFKLSLKLV